MALNPTPEDARLGEASFPRSRRPEAARRGLPLYAKILGWFFLNLVLLGIVGWLAIQQQFRAGFDTLLGGPAGDRVRSLAGLLSQELQDRPRSQWSEALARYEHAYSVRAYLFMDDGKQVSGASVQLPQPVLTRMTRNPRPPRPAARPPERAGFRDGPPFDDEGPPEGENMRRPPPPREGPPPRNRPPLLDGPPPIEARPPGQGKLSLDQRRPELLGLVRSANPTTYWLPIRIPPPPREDPLTLVLASNTLSAGGLLFDPAPLLWAAVAAVVLSLLFWLPLVRNITRSIGEMRDAAARIADGKFDARVSDRRRDELGALGAGINTMAERLAGLLNGQRRFLSDVAHELCAPLSRLQVALGILEERAGARSDGESAQWQGRIGDVREEVDQMASLVNELLSFSRAALGARQVRLQPVQVRAVLDTSVRREIVEGAAEVQILCDEGLQAKADPDLLGRAVGNLLRNAVRYAGDAGVITVSGERRNGVVQITVSDRGPGVPAKEIPKLFDPFYRVDTSRTRETGGVGLGLAIAKTCVDACGGTIQARAASGGGLEVSISLQP